MHRKTSPTVFRWLSRVQPIVLAGATAELLHCIDLKLPWGLLIKSGIDFSALELSLLRRKLNAKLKDVPTELACRLHTNWAVGLCTRSPCLPHHNLSIQETNSIWFSIAWNSWNVGTDSKTLHWASESTPPHPPLCETRGKIPLPTDRRFL